MCIICLGGESRLQGFTGRQDTQTEGQKKGKGVRETQGNRKPVLKA